MAFLSRMIESEYNIKVREGENCGACHRGRWLIFDWGQRVLVAFCYGQCYVMIKYFDQKQCVALTYGSRGRNHNDQGGITADSQGKKLRDHLFNHKHEAEKVNGKSSEVMDSQTLPPVIIYLPHRTPSHKGPTASPKSTTRLGANVQICEPTRGTYDSNHHTAV